MSPPPLHIYNSVNLDSWIWRRLQVQPRLSRSGRAGVLAARAKTTAVSRCGVAAANSEEAEIKMRGGNDINEEGESVWFGRAGNDRGRFDFARPDSS